MVVVAYVRGGEGGSLTRGSKYRDLTWNLVVETRGSTVLMLFKKSRSSARSSTCIF